MKPGAKSGGGVSWKTLFRLTAGIIGVLGLLMIGYGLFFQAETTYECVDTITNRPVDCPLGVPGTAPPSNWTGRNMTNVTRWLL